MEELDKLCDECNVLRIEWHELSRKYQEMPYGPARYIAQHKCRLKRAEWERAKKQLTENMNKTYTTNLKENK